MSLRTLMLLVIPLGAILGRLTVQIQTQRQAIAAVRAAGGQITFDYQSESLPTYPGLPAQYRTEPSAPQWLRQVLGDELFQSVRSVSLATSNHEPAPLAALARFDQLRILELTDNSPVDAGYAKLRRLGRLGVLHLGGVGLTDSKLAALGPLPALQTFTLDQRYQAHTGQPTITDAGLVRALAGMPRLCELTIDYHQWAPHAAIRGLPRSQPNLETLKIPELQLTDLDLAAIGQLPRLEVLDMVGVPVTDAGLAHLAGLARLRDLNLFGAPVTDAGLVHLVHLPRLSVLNLAHTQVTDAGLPTLAQVESLSDLDLSLNPGITLAGMIPANFGLNPITVRLARRVALAAENGPLATARSNVTLHDMPDLIP